MYTDNSIQLSSCCSVQAPHCTSIVIRLALVCVPQLRDFLHDSLYHPTEGYFTAQQPPVGVGRPLDLPALSDEDAYRMEVRRQYDDLAVWASHAYW